MATAVATQEYRAIVINLRWCGKSTGPSEGVTLQTNANDVAGVIKALNIGPVHLAGNDFGSRVARMLAASHPELVRSVILIAAGGKIQPKPEASRALEVIFNPASTEAEVLAEMKYLVANQGDAARVWKILNASRDPKAGAIEEAAAKATPLEAWWAPPGKDQVLDLTGSRRPNRSTGKRRCASKGTGSPRDHSERARRGASVTDRAASNRGISSLIR